MVTTLRVDGEFVAHVVNEKFAALMHHKLMRQLHGGHPPREVDIPRHHRASTSGKWLLFYKGRDCYRRLRVNISILQ